VHARGTTLGADNGIGLAAALAVAEDAQAVHGPLEILCTVDEETGMTGAKNLDPEIVSGKTMINLDTEEDGAIYIGCAGGADLRADLQLLRRRGLLHSTPLRLAVRGLRGGHSGLNIIENRANAIKLAVRVVLAALDEGLQLDLVSIDGGSKHNAIPREAFAVCRLHRDDVARFRDVAEASAEEFLKEFAATDPDLEVAVEPLDEAEQLQQVLNAHARDRLLRMLDGMPHGVLAMSREVPGLVETSNNLAVVQTQDDHASVVTSQRSSVMPALRAVGRQVRSICLQAGATVSEDDPYPGWTPNPSSPIVQRTAGVYRKAFGSEPELKAIHAGLECGLLIEKVPGLDAVSIGPEIQNAHSPDERVQVSSVERFYHALKMLLEELA
jgi:dipeptidase D